MRLDLHAGTSAALAALQSVWQVALLAVAVPATVQHSHVYRHPGRLLFTLLYFTCSTQQAVGTPIRSLFTFNFPPLTSCYVTVLLIHTCRYLCSSGCIAKCVADDNSSGGGTGNGTAPPILPPSWPPADWPYYCLDGSPAQKCDNPISNSNDSCDKMGCGPNSPSGIPRQDKTFCAAFKCGTSDSAVCQMTCVRDVSFSVPPPLPAGPMCLDGKTVAEWCSSGATQEYVDGQCWQLGCEKDGVMCGEFKCGAAGANGELKCDVACVTDAYYVPYK
jgi:hypothetical protein